MDSFEVAQEMELLIREYQIAKSSTGPVLQAVGQCHFCDAALSNGQRFCDADCRDGWADEQNAKARNGTPTDYGRL